MLVGSHDRYFLNQVADRLIVLGNGKTRVIEGDYETYQRRAQQEAEAAAAKARNASFPCPPPSTDGPQGDRTEPQRKRKYPYRKPADVERKSAKSRLRLPGSKIFSPSQVFSAIRSVGLSELSPLSRPDLKNVPGELP